MTLFYSLVVVVVVVVVHDSNISANALNNGLQKISEWIYQWKMSFKPDLNKQVEEAIFSRKLNKPSHPKVIFNSVPVVCTDWQKKLGM